MAYFLGVDGGQSSTLSAICDGDGCIVGIGRGGPSNHILAPGGEMRARTAIQSAVEAARAAAGLRQHEFAAAHFGMTGINRDTEQARVFARVAAVVVSTPITRIDSDASVALAGALAGRPGVIVIAGTGSVAFGRDGNGQEARAGGWGYLFGDEGSGFALGLAGVRAALRARDGTGPATALAEAIPRHFGAALGMIPRQYYDERIGRPAIAALAPLVANAAQCGDAVAAGILDDAAGSLAAMAASVIARLAWDGPVPLAPVGGLFEAGRVLQDRFRAAVAARAPAAVLVAPRFSPAVGALLLALDAAGIARSPERLALLAATWDLRMCG